MNAQIAMPWFVCLGILFGISYLCWSMSAKAAVLQFLMDETKRINDRIDEIVYALDLKDAIQAKREMDDLRQTISEIHECACYATWDKVDLLIRRGIIIEKCEEAIPFLVLANPNKNGGNNELA